MGWGSNKNHNSEQLVFLLKTAIALVVKIDYNYIVTLDSLNINSGSAIPLLSKLKGSEIKPNTLKVEAENDEKTKVSGFDGVLGSTNSENTVGLIKPIESNSTTPDTFLFSDQMHAQPPIFADPSFLETRRYHPVGNMVESFESPMIIREKGYYISISSDTKTTQNNLISERSEVDSEKIRRRYSKAQNQARGKLVDISG